MSVRTRSLFLAAFVGCAYVWAWASIDEGNRRIGVIPGNLNCDGAISCAVAGGVAAAVGGHAEGICATRSAWSPNNRDHATHATGRSIGRRCTGNETW